MKCCYKDNKPSCGSFLLWCSRLPDVSESSGCDGYLSSDKKKKKLTQFCSFMLFSMANSRRDGDHVVHLNLDIKLHANHRCEDFSICHWDPGKNLRKTVSIGERAALRNYTAHHLREEMRTELEVRRCKQQGNWTHQLLLWSDTQKKKQQHC